MQNHYTQKGHLFGEVIETTWGVTYCYDECGNIVDKYADFRTKEYWEIIKDLFKEWWEPYEHFPNDGFGPDDLPTGGGSPPVGPPPVPIRMCPTPYGVVPC